MSSEEEKKDNKFGSIVIYELEDGETNINVRFEDETVYLNQEQLCILYSTSKSNISEHIKNIFEERELDENSVVRFFRTTASDGKNYNVKFYNLDMIISLGYRVKSKTATHFRRWATARLKEYMLKGFALDDKRLKEAGGGDYWKELLERIRDIRSSEKIMYRQVLDLYATSVDYDPKSSESVAFFKMVQNKLHYAVNGKTAPELIYDRADSNKPFMGLKSFKGDFPVKSDVVIAKNYLDEDELKILNSLVSGFFDFAEAQALRKRAMHMSDYTLQLDSLLSASGNKVLDNAGSISRAEADKKALNEYRKFQKNSLSPVEKSYLDSIKVLSDKAKKYSNDREIKK